jgi:hypothetical protein
MAAASKVPGPAPLSMTCRRSLSQSHLWDLLQTNLWDPGGLAHEVGRQEARPASEGLIVALGAVVDPVALALAPARDNHIRGGWVGHTTAYQR